MPNVSALFRSAFEVVYRRLSPRGFKQYRELVYWKYRKDLETNLVNDHYATHFTRCFDLDAQFYAGKRLLDIGCGPRGSLEWASMAAERVGLDPLVPAYLKLGAGSHHMQYVAAPAEEMPFPDGYFDVVSSFNSLDHVDDLLRAIAEIKRVVRPGGLFLLIIEANHPAMVTEPITFHWEDVAFFEDAFEIVDLRKYEIGEGDLYQQITKNQVYDESDPGDRIGVLAAKFKRKPVVLTQ